MDSNSKGDLAEDFVNKIAYSTFLKYWCFPNPLDVGKDNKEICDLLIIFDDICIIISVKNYSFLGNYEKYFRKTVDKAVRQIFGAERKLFGERQILLKHPDREIEVFHREKVRLVLRIIVNTNPAVKFYYTSFCPIPQTPVIIFDAEAWQSLVTEMDTVTDFVRYLLSRQLMLKERATLILPREEYDFSPSDGDQFLKEGERLQHDGGSAIISGSEKDLIALYIINGLKFPEKLANAKESFLQIFADGAWEKYLKSKLKRDKQEFESEGYFIDYLVKNLLIKVTEGDKISMAFYRLDRVQRARFTQDFFRFHKEQASKDPIPHLHRTNLVFDDSHFIFVFFDTAAPDLNEDMLEGFIDKSLHHRNYLMNYTCQEIIAIAFSHDLDSFAFGYFSKDNPLTTEERQTIENSFRVLNWKERED